MNNYIACIYDEFTISFLFVIYACVLIETIGIGIVHYKEYDNAFKIIFFLIVFTFMDEVVVFIIKNINHKNQSPVYHVFNVIELYSITLYFLALVKIKNRNVRLPILSVLQSLPNIAIFNIIAFQPIYQSNSNFVLFENISTMCMALYFLYAILMNDEIVTIVKYPHFWIWSLLLLLASGTFFFWIYIKVVGGGGKYIDTAQLIAGIINVVVYAGIGLTFLYYPKRADEWKLR